MAIVDTDCHHGDGTQDIYWHDPDTLFISLHQDGRTLYPGSGFPGELGGPNAVGTTLNIPLPPHTAEEGFLHVIRNAVRPILDDFKPQLIVNSAGQDNHYTDPITNMNFSAQGYAELTALLNADIAVLETVTPLRAPCLTSTWQLYSPWPAWTTARSGSRTTNVARYASRRR